MLSCALPQVLLALQGIAPNPALTEAPPELRDPHPAPPVPGSKAIYGGHLSNYIDTDNFTVEWTDPNVTRAEANAVAEAMEAAWTALIEEQGWPEPVSSDDYLLWVILDETLSATGYTTEYLTDDYPDGYPVMYVNTAYSYHDDFLTSLSAHEFAHAVQFGIREWDLGEGESWHWEASAEWMAERAVPERDTYAWSSEWYATAPDDDHDSTNNYHQYGMFVLDAYLEEYVFGDDGLRDLWVGNENRPWVEEIEAATDMDAGLLWAGFSGAYAARALRESDLYDRPTEAEDDGRLRGWLGTDYLDIGDVDGSVWLDGGVGAVVRDGEWVVFEGSVNIPEGSGDVTLTVTNPTEDRLTYSWWLGDPIEEDPEDTGSGDSGAEDTGSDYEFKVDPADCGCAAGRARGAAWTVLVGLMAVFGRRRSSGRDRTRSP